MITSAVVFGVALIVGLILMRDPVAEVLPFRKPRYTMQDVIRLMRAHTDATAPDQVIGAAIVQAESAGNPVARLDNKAQNPPGKGVDRGLWQINSFWHPEVSDPEADDPVASTKHAWRIKKARGWSEWSTFKGKTPPYLKFLSGAEQALKEVEAGNTSQIV